MTLTTGQAGRNNGPKRIKNTGLRVEIRAQCPPSWIRASASQQVLPTAKGHTPHPYQQLALHSLASPVCEPAPIRQIFTLQQKALRVISGSVTGTRLQRLKDRVQRGRPSAEARHGPVVGHVYGVSPISAPRIGLSSRHLSPRAAIPRRWPSSAPSSREGVGHTCQGHLGDFHDD
jgi:hypothetical protein